MTNIPDDIRSAMAKVTGGQWTWEKEFNGTATLYADRGRDMDEGVEGSIFPAYTHGMNLFGRIEPDQNGDNNLDAICLVINWLKRELATPLTTPLQPLIKD